MNTKINELKLSLKFFDRKIKSNSIYIKLTPTINCRTVYSLLLKNIEYRKLYYHYMYYTYLLLIDIYTL